MIENCYLIKLAFKNHSLMAILEFMGILLFIKFGISELREYIEDSIKESYQLFLPFGILVIIFNLFLFLIDLGRF